MYVYERRLVMSDSVIPWTGNSIHGIFWQDYWSGLPLPSPGDLPNPGIKPRFPTLQADSLLPESPGKP